MSPLPQCDGADDSDISNIDDSLSSLSADEISSIEDSHSRLSGDESMEHGPIYLNGKFNIGLVLK